MIHTSVPDQIDPVFAIVAGIILWVIFLIILLVQLRRRKVRGDHKRRLALIAARREEYIESTNAADEQLYEDNKKEQ